MLALIALFLGGTLDRLASTAFSDDGAHFAYFVGGQEDGSGFAFARFAVLATDGNKSVLAAKMTDESQVNDNEAAAVRALQRKYEKKLKPLGLNDPGREMYTTGTKTKTSFDLDGKKVEVELRLKALVGAEEEWGQLYKLTVAIKVGGNTQVIDPKITAPGINMSGVKVSKDGKAIAVMFKYNVPPGFEGLDRAYGAVAARIP